jgi:phosphomannomutase/phosphoglucomutase
MKFFGVHPSKADGADTARRPWSFSMAQLAMVGSAVAGCILLIAAVGVYYINGRTVDRYFQERARVLSGELAYGLVGLVQASIAKVEWLSLDPRVVHALEGRKPAQLAATEARLVKKFPELVRVRLIPPGVADTIEGGIFPELGFADLEMLKAAEATGKPPPIEAHFFGMEMAHVDIVRPVRADDGKVVGELLVSYGAHFVQRVLNQVTTPFGFVEVRQFGSDRHTGAVLATRGQADLMGSESGYTVPVTGTRWEVSYWPDPAARGKLSRDGAVIWGVFAVVFLLLSAIAYILQRILSQVFQADLESILEVLRGHKAGQFAYPDHPFRLRDFQGKWEILDAMATVGTETRPRETEDVIRTTVVKTSSTLPGGKAAKTTQYVVENEHGGGVVVKAPASIFRAYDIRGVVGKTLTEEIVYKIGLAIGSEAFARGQQTIIVGRDGRLSGEKFAEALSKGLCDAGRDVIDIGQVPTPVVYFATHYLNTGSGVMVTGSHNPPDYNGLKMVLKGETLAERDIQQLRRRIEMGDFTNGSGSVRRQDVIADYVATIVGDVKLARPLKVVIDCGNGVAGAVAPQLLRTLGCELIELYCDVDGHFPNHHPDPSQLDNLRDLIAAVSKHNADLGLAFDGDGDRIALVDGHGKVIWPDRQLMLYAKDVLARNPGATIIFDVKCSRHLAKYITNYGGQPLMWRTGHSLIKRKMKETGALLAGEMSGHIFFKERWFGFDDGIYSAARLLEILAAERRGVAEVFQSLPDAVSTPELRVDLAEGQQTVFMARLLETANIKGAVLTTIDGLRADFADGWGLVRASNTTPSLILRFEANTESALKRIKEEFRALMRKVDPKVRLPF